MEKFKQLRALIRELGMDALPRGSIDKGRDGSGRHLEAWVEEPTRDDPDDC
jgi:hypothetical protein